MPLSYANPVYPDGYADPFVLKHGDHYCVYGTGSNIGGDPAPNGRIFPALRSPDLVHWELLGGALVPPDGGRALWAPEVTTGAGYGVGGVGVAGADTVLGPHSKPAPGPRVLRGVPGHVVGPGHNSVVRGPDNTTDFLAYHAWDAACALTRCDGRLRPLPRDGPTWTPQILP